MGCKAICQHDSPKGSFVTSATDNVPGVGAFCATVKSKRGRLCNCATDYYSSVLVCPALQIVVLSSCTSLNRPFL